MHFAYDLAVLGTNIGLFPDGGFLAWQPGLSSSVERVCTANRFTREEFPRLSNTPRPPEGATIVAPFLLRILRAAMRGLWPQELAFWYLPRGMHNWWSSPRLNA
jgi:hypothetical protein